MTLEALDFSLIFLFLGALVAILVGNVWLLYLVVSGWFLYNVLLTARNF